MDRIETSFGHPIALLIGNGNQVAWPNAHAVWIAEASGDHFDARSVLRHFQGGAAVRRVFGALGEIKIPGGICFERSGVAVASARADARCLRNQK